MADKTAEERIAELEAQVAKLTKDDGDGDGDKPLSPREFARRMTPAEAREALREMHKRAGPTNRLRAGLRAAYPDTTTDEEDDQ